VGDYIDNKQLKRIPLGKSDQTTEQISPLEAVEKTTIQVYIVGEVQVPGLYSIEKGSRVQAVVDLAGGLTTEAVLMNNNMARVPKDGEKIIILGPVTDATSYPELAGKINLNTATLEELDSLHGIGEVLAKRILADRTENGLYSEVNDIMRVKGIGEAKFKLFEKQVCVF
jgi:competence protein ComEA